MPQLPVQPQPLPLHRDCSPLRSMVRTPGRMAVTVHLWWTVDRQGEPNSVHFLPARDCPAASYWSQEGLSSGPPQQSNTVQVRMQRVTVTEAQT